MDRHYDALVAGAGIAGLVSAQLLARAGLRVAVLEAEARAGGAIHSARFALDGQDYWLELGAHTLFNTYPSLLAFFPELHLGEIVLRRRRLPYRLWQAGRTHSVLSALHWGELARHLPRAFLCKRAGRRVIDYFTAVAGARNYAAVIGPALDALLCQPAEEFPAELLFKRHESTPEFPRSFSLQGGLGALTERMAQGLELHTATPVRRIARDGERMVCETAADHFLAPRLLLAVPVAEAARLLAEIAPEIARRLAQIPMQQIDSTAVVVRAESVPLEPVAGIVARAAPWYSMVSRDVVPDRGLRGFTFHFRPQFSAEERLDVAAQTLGVERDALLASAHVHHRLPGLRLGHAARMGALDELLRNLPIGLAGNYFGGLSIEECAARARRESERLLHGEIPGHRA